MSKLAIERSTLTAIGDAVREKKGSNEKILVSELATAIKSLSSGSVSFVAKQERLQDRNYIPFDPERDSAPFIIILGGDIKAYIVNFKTLQIYKFFAWNGGYSRWNDLSGDPDYSIKKTDKGYSIYYTNSIMYWSNKENIEIIYTV